MEELGGIRLGFDAGNLVLETPGGLRGTSDADLLAGIERRAVEAEERLAALVRQMEAVGITPEMNPRPRIDGRWGAQPGGSSNRNGVAGAPCSRMWVSSSTRLAGRTISAVASRSAIVHHRCSA